MEKRTPVTIYEPAFSISVTDTIFSTGSCFSHEIAAYFKKHGVYVLSNPFGTIYNTYSIYMVFERIINNYRYTKDDLYCANDIFFSLEHATAFDSTDCNKTVDAINATITKAYAYIKKCTVFILTPGTSVVFMYNQAQRIAANCHKLPHSLFSRTLLSVDENSEYLRNTVRLIRSCNPDAKIIITLSPIRHNSGDLTQNSLSKALVRAGIEQVLHDDDKTCYFPSYEIVLDELRDYSFYSKDLLHLTDEAVDYVVQKFRKTFFDATINNYIKEYGGVKKILLHRPKEPYSHKHLAALKKCLLKLNELYQLKKSSIITYTVFIVAKRMIKYFYHDPDVNDFLQEQLARYKPLAALFKVAYMIKNNHIKNLNEKKFMSFVKSAQIQKYKKMLLFEYYKGARKYKKLLAIILKK